MRVEVKDADGQFLQADKISCQMTKSDGDWLYGVERNTDKAEFEFRVRKKTLPGNTKFQWKRPRKVIRTPQ